MNLSALDILSRGAGELGLVLDSRQLDQFVAYTGLLLGWNRKLNLTRIVDPKEIAVKHYLDSLTLPAVTEIPDGSWLIDIGTGAGFPAIPLKIIIPGLRITLVDSVEKKLMFLETVVKELGLIGVELVHGRAEDLGHDQHYREKYDFSVSRAVGKLSMLAELCIPFCQVGGLFAAYKGPRGSAEVDEAQGAFQLLGGKLEAVHRLALPFSDQERSLILVRKSRPTPAKYPRQAGIPERSPLGGDHVQS